MEHTYSTIAAIHVYDTTPVKKLRVVRTNTTYLQCIAAIKVHLNEIYTVKVINKIANIFKIISLIDPLSIETQGLRFYDVDNILQQLSMQ